MRRCQSTGVGAAVLMEMDDADLRLQVRVTDRADLAIEEEPVALALVRGLADTVLVGDGPGGAGGMLEMGWALVGQ